MAKETNQTVNNALEVVECFVSADEIGIREIAEKLHVGIASAARLVASLESYGYLQQNPNTKKYRLGTRFLYWASLSKDRNEIVYLLQPYLEHVAEQFQATAHLSVWDKDKVLILRKIIRGQVVTMSSREGSTLPAHACAMGKCLLAFRNEDEVNDFINSNKFETYTENTITDRKKLLKEIAQVKKNGYAIDNEEASIGLYCVAIPLTDRRNRVVAACSLSGLPKVMRGNKNEILKALQHTAKMVEDSL